MTYKHSDNVKVTVEFTVNVGDVLEVTNNWLKYDTQSVQVAMAQLIQEAMYDSEYGPQLEGDFIVSSDIRKG